MVHSINNTFPLDFPIYFGDVVAVAPISKYNYDLAIYYNSLTGNDYIDCRCSRWSQQNKSIVVETWLNKSQLSVLISNTRPGAVKSLYTILADEHFFDTSWQGYNTLLLKPTPSSCRMNSSNLKNMRSEKVIYVKNLSTHTIEGSHGLIECKIEAYISGSGI